LYTLGNFTSKFLGFFLVFVLTFFLSKEELGFYDLVLTSISLFVPIVSLQIGDAAFRWLIENSKSLTISMVFTNSIILYFILFLIFSFSATIFYCIFDWEYYWIIFLIIVMQCLYTFFRQLLRGMNKSKIFALSGVVFVFLYLFLAGISLYLFENKILSVLISYLIATTSIVIILFLKEQLWVYFQLSLYSKEISLELLKYSIPLLPNSLSWWAISSVNRYLILFFLGVSYNGIFAIAFKIPTLLLLFVGVFQLAWQEKAISNYSSQYRDQYYSKIHDYFLRFIFSISVIVIIFNKLILDLIVSENFFEAWKYTSLLLLSMIFSSLSGFYGIGYLSSKKTSGASTSTISGALVTVVLSVLLIPSFELYGASLAIVFGYLVTYIIRLYHSKKFFKIEINKAVFFKLFFLYVLVSAVSYWDFNYSFLFNLLIGLGFLIKINITEIRLIWSNRKIVTKRIWKN